MECGAKNLDSSINNVSKTILSHQYFDDLCHPFLVKLGMVYYCFIHGRHFFCLPTIEHRLLRRSLERLPTDQAACLPDNWRILRCLVGYSYYTRYLSIFPISWLLRPKNMKTHHQSLDILAYLCLVGNEGMIHNH